ncbi:MFS domain-containing protein [Fusarium sp. Ph1]|nr:MFS domain-containing protein [Fusarium sp. Ph1]
MALWKHDLRGQTLVLAINLASCQAFLLLGFDQGVMVGLIGAENRFGRDFNHPGADMQGNITALYNIGCVVGSIICYFIGKRFGRRAMLIAGGSIMIVGAAILASSYAVAQLIVGRIVTGIGNGMNSSTAPVYQSECSPAAIRVIGLPESPRWLVQYEQYEEARHIIAAIPDKPDDDADVNRTLPDIRSGLEEEQKDGPSASRNFSPAARSRTCGDCSSPSPSSLHSSSRAAT